jgi:hypothetical protein
VHTKPLSKTESWSNQHAEIIGRLTKVQYQEVFYAAVRADDYTVEGRASEYSLRLAAYVRHLNLERKKIVDQVESDQNPSRHARCFINLADIEMELQLFSGLLGTQLQLDTPKYPGPPLFTIRETNTVVIQKKDQAAFDTLVRAPYDAQKLYELLRKVRVSPLC